MLYVNRIHESAVLLVMVEVAPPQKGGPHVAPPEDGGPRVQRADHGCGHHRVHIRPNDAPPDDHRSIVRRVGVG